MKNMWLEHIFSVVCTRLWRTLTRCSHGVFPFVLLAGTLWGCDAAGVEGGGLVFGERFRTLLPALWGPR